MKKFLLFFALISLNINLFSFEWPLSDVNKDSFKSYFSQLRGKKISTSLIFKDPEEVKSAEEGRILIIIEDPEDDSDFFPSVLGTAVIISHEDNLHSVYANLDSESLTLNYSDDTFIEEGSILGNTGNTGWQEDENSLEFQIIDTKNTSSINPKVLMTRLESENKYNLSDISLVNRNGEKFPLSTNKTFPAGLYKVYQKRNPVITPAKTTVLYNGIIVDELLYNTIIQENGKVCIKGSKKKYTCSEVYPKDNMFLLGEAMLTPGKITLGIAITDSLGQFYTLNYNLITY